MRRLMIMKKIIDEDNFINFLMAIVIAPVVLSWVGLAVFLIVQAFNDEQVVTDIESYKSVLLIVGSPALVIIYKVLEMWTSQQNSKIEEIRKAGEDNKVSLDELDEALVGSAMLREREEKKK